MTQENPRTPNFPGVEISIFGAKLYALYMYLCALRLFVKSKQPTFD